MSDQKPYIVSARKYRPATFRSVVGQSTLTATLKNAIDSKRLAQAYLFCGPRGVGKTSCARIFAKTINCLSPTPDGEACGECESCRAIEQGNSFNLVELDAASNNSVDDIRSITEQVHVPPQRGNYRVFIIDEVHMLSNAAFNAFLKTLEEPPSYVVFILATTEKHKVIPTILSRCQIYDFKRITVNDMIDHLAYVAETEKIHTDRDALGVIALKADGAMRDALSIFDQVAASSRGEVTYVNTIQNLNVLDYDYYFRLVDAFREGDVATSLLIYKEIRDKGFDSLFFINGLAAHVRDLMVSADPRTSELLEISAETASRYSAQASTLPAEWYYAAMKLLSDCDINYRTSSSKRLLVELTLIRLCQLLKPATPPFDALDRRVPLGDPTKEHKVASPVSSSTHTNTSLSPSVSESQTSSTVTSGPAIAETPSAPSYGREADKTPPRPKPTARPSSIRISDNGTTSRQNPSSLERRKEVITIDKFMEAWGVFISRNPEMHILVNTMRASTPELRGDDKFHILVDHPAQLQAFDMAMTKLLEFLRDYLRNDFLTLTVEVKEQKGETHKKLPKDFLADIVKENPMIAGFLNEINAEMA